MQMSLHQSLTVDPAHDPNPKFFSHTQYSVFADAYDDRLSTTDSSERGQSILHHRGTTAPMQPYDKEPMFEKPLTPSDVGKLNRLVIPKQYAERYFPIGGGGGGDAAGTLLGFEDEAGKCWRFRYSYWNSSQSYVLTKGWSRYVKDKRLDAGDVVLFERHRNNPDRLFIGWRRRGAAAAVAGSFCYNAQGRFQAQDSRGQGQGGGGGGGGADSLHAAAGLSVGVDPEQEPTAGSSNTSTNTRKLVRLFGVNLECQVENSSSPQTTSSAPSFWSTQQRQQQLYHNYFDYNQNHHHHMVMNFGEGVNQMGNRLG